MAIFGGSINRLETQLRKLRLNGLWRGGRGMRSSNGDEAEIPSAEDFAIYEDSASGGDNQESSRREHNDDYFNARSASPLETASEQDITDIVLWGTGNMDGMTLYSGEENQPREELTQREQDEQDIDDNETACCYENTEHRDVRRFSGPRSTSQTNQSMQQRLCVMMAIEHSFSFGSGLPVSQSRLRQDRQASRTTDPRKRNSWSKQEEHTKRQSLPVVDTSEVNLAQQMTSYSSSASRQTVSPDNHHKTIRPISIFTDFASTAWTKSWQRIKYTFKKPAQEPSSDQQKLSEDA